MPSDIDQVLQSIHACRLSSDGGAPAANLPELSQTEADRYGICVITVDGSTHAVGDSTAAFTMQSIAKPFVYGMALEELGLTLVRRRIGVEPTGNPFDSVPGRDEVAARRFNPMVNAGAIATTSLIQGRTLEGRWERMRSAFGRYLCRNVRTDEPVLTAKRHADHATRGLAHLMCAEGMVDGAIDDVIELYFRQCSVRVDCHDLALMAATLANGGRNPVSGELAISRRHVRHVLSVMFSSGMYDFSGQWAYRVGLPAKSGLSGAILAVVPGRFGVAVYSPRLGDHSKSVRGVETCEDLARRLKLHVFEAGPPAQRRRAISVGSPVFEETLQRLHTTHQGLTTGHVYVSDPSVARTHGAQFGICAVSIDGQTCGVGDADVPFLIQSISKVFTYGLALEDHGRAAVLAKVDIEPTGHAYDSMIRVEKRSKRPYNPMVNTGGIATASLVHGNNPAERLSRILSMYARYVGHPVFVDTPAFLAEQASNHRNRSISYLLRHFDMIEGPVEHVLDLYLQQCSVLVTVRDLALMAATLANDGVNPVTGERAIAADYVRDMLTVMCTCGMYDFSGEWAFNVGFPAKSGVGGGIIVVVPGSMGLAVFSPPLDEHGASVRGVRVCEDLFMELGIHPFEPTGRRPAPLTSVSTSASGAQLSA